MSPNPAFASVGVSANKPLISLLLIIIAINEVSYTAKNDKHLDNAEAQVPHHQDALALQYFSASDHNPQISPGAF